MYTHRPVRWNLQRLSIWRRFKYRRLQGYSESSLVSSHVVKLATTLTPISLLMFALFLVRFGLGSINKFAFRMIGIRLSAAIRLHYLQRLFGQSIHVLDSLPPGYAVGTITSTSNTLQLGISEKLGVFVEYNSLIIAAIIVAFTWNWELALVTSAGIIFILLCVSGLLPLILKGHTQQSRSESRAAAIASEAIANIRMVMACGREEDSRAIISDHVAHD